MYVCFLNKTDNLKEKLSFHKLRPCLGWFKTRHLATTGIFSALKSCLKCVSDKKWQFIAKLQFLKSKFTKLTTFIAVMKLYDLLLMLFILMTLCAIMDWWRPTFVRNFFLETDSWTIISAMPHWATTSCRESRIIQIIFPLYVFGM